jgi:regulation of enolase protein 1 (concanavalin A-like superfamily)
VPGGEIYFRITGAVPGDTFSLYFSRDGKSWSLVRGFRLEKTDALRVGFSAQSPVGEGCSVKFSEIKLERRAPKDWWTGE